ncbi:MAG: metallophosphatase family protein [Planctomycetes bacterium]|nr:metallophosphatase family protein [Planctomycetota bacterium]
MRKIGILGDLHANLSAFEAALALLEIEGVDAAYCVGDIIGYGARPNEVIDLLIEKNITCVAGNHDWALLGKIPEDSFNPYARASLEWTRANIRPSARDYLDALPLRIDTDLFCLVHGALPRPEEFEYLQSFPAALATLADFEAPICFVGHTHVPMNFIQTSGRSELDWHFRVDWHLDLPGGQRAVVNVGSPGQPRDEIPTAPALVYDLQTGRAQLLRTPYNIAVEQRLIRRAGLPTILGDRLQRGI